MTQLQALEKLTATQAQQIAEGFIVDHIGDQVLAGEPWPILSTLSSGWVIPLILTRSAYGPIGAIGVLVVDQNTGHIIASTPTEILQGNSNRLLNEQTTSLETAFNQLIAQGHTSN